MGLTLDQAIAALKKLGKGATIRLTAFEPVFGEDVNQCGAYMAGRLVTADRTGLWIEWLQGPTAQPGVQALWPHEDWRYEDINIIPPPAKTRPVVPSDPETEQQPPSRPKRARANRSLDSQPADDVVEDAPPEAPHARGRKREVTQTAESRGVYLSEAQFRRLLAGRTEKGRPKRPRSVSSSDSSFSEDSTSSGSTNSDHRHRKDKKYSASKIARVRAKDMYTSPSGCPTSGLIFPAIIPVEDEWLYPHLALEALKKGVSVANIIETMEAKLMRVGAARLSEYGSYVQEHLRSGYRAWLQLAATQLQTAEPSTLDAMLEVGTFWVTSMLMQLAIPGGATMFANFRKELQKQTRKRVFVLTKLLDIVAVAPSVGTASNKHLRQAPVTSQKDPNDTKMVGSPKPKKTRFSSIFRSARQAKRRT